MKPPVPYYGAKGRLAKRIVRFMPNHRVYIEPFFGSGAVLFEKAPRPIEIVNDLDGNVVNFFTMLRTRRDELAEVCFLTPYAREEFDAADLDADVDDLERARRFWVRVNQSFSKSTSDQTGWSVTTARSQSVANTMLGRLDRFAPVADRLLHTVIECCDGVDLITRLATSDDVLIYADPPYLAATRRLRAGRDGRPDRTNPGDYAHDMGTDDEHRRLAAALHETPATVVLSGYPSELYAELYAGWWYHDFQVTVQSSDAQHGRGARVERMWSNRQLDEGRLRFETVMA